MKHKRKPREWFDTSVAPEWISNAMDWQNTPEETRAWIVRRDAEQLRGIAIAKDRRYGRPKNDPDGFYGLQLAKEQLAYLERHLPADHAALIDARAQVERWSAHEEAWFARMQGFENYAKARGMTLAQLLGYYEAIEQRMLANPIDGMRYLWELTGDGRPFEAFWHSDVMPAQQGNEAHAVH